jgi:hypothetical protein
MLPVETREQYPQRRSLPSEPWPVLAFLKTYGNVAVGTAEKDILDISDAEILQQNFQL